MDSAPQNAMSSAVRYLAILLALFFVLTAVAALVLFNIERQAFSPATYQRALIRENFYQKFPSLLGDLLGKNLGQSAPAFARQMSADNWKMLIEALLPEQQLQAMTEDTINQVFAYLNGETRTPGISFAPLKQGLASPSGLNAALTIIHSQPDCTIAQVVRVITSFGEVLCNPPQEVLDTLRPIIQTQLLATAAAIPDAVPLIKNTNSASAQSRLQGLKAIRLLMRLGPLIPFALLLGITLLAVRTLKGWLMWWGWPLLLTGLFGMLLGFAGAPLFRLWMERWLSRRISINMPSEVADALRAIVDAALREMLKPAGWEALALFVIGVAMVLGAAYYTRRERKKLAASEAATQIS